MRAAIQRLTNLNKFLIKHSMIFGDDSLKILISYPLIEYEGVVDPSRIVSGMNHLDYVINYHRK